MPFTYKLSQRLARIRRSAFVVRTAALAILLVFACELPSKPHLPGDLPIYRVAITPSALRLQQNQTADLVAIVLTTEGFSADFAVNWSSSSGAVTDTITSNGNHYGRYRAGQDTGKIKVIAKIPGGQADTAVVTVTSASVGAVPVSPVSVTLQAGRTVQLFATPSDGNGNPLSERLVSWTTSNAAAATVNASGLVSGVAPGIATITATSEGQSGAAAVTVTAPPVASVSVSPASASVAVGQTLQLAATPKDANGNPLTGRTVTWATTNAAVASVNGSGLVSGISAGVATISASSEGQAGGASITVSGVPVASVTVSPASANLQVGQTVQLTGTPRDAGGNPLSGRAVIWTTSNGSVASVSGTGLVTGTGAGSATITATSEGQSATSAISVTAVPVASVAVNPPTASVAVGQNVQLTAIPKDASGNPLNGRLVAWSTSNAAVATVTSSGLVSGVASGSATITATSEAKSGTATITVTAPPPPPPPTATPGTVTDLAVASATDNAVTLSFTEASNGAGQPASYDIRWAAGSLSWGSAQGVSQGTCSVPLAGTAIGASRSCTVLGLQSGTGYQFQLVAFRGTLNVDAVFGGLSNVATGTTVSSSAPVATVTVSPASASVAVGGVQQFTALLKDASGATLTGRQVTWSSGNTGIATVVSGTGLVTALAAGTATITASSEGHSGTAAVTVTAAGPGGVVFESNWTTAVGTSSTAVRDGTRWLNYWEFNNNTSVQLLSVVAGGPPGYANALKVVQRGSSYAANLQNDNVLPASTDFYLRFYMRNDDNSSPGDHIVTVDTWGYSNLTFIRKYGGANSWRYVSSLYGCGYNYPIGHWGPTVAMNNGVWYRFEYFVHFVDPTHVQVHTRVYDANGTQIMGDADIKQSDFGGASWNGRSDWTWASYYAAGYSFCVDPALMRNFSLGNNGQAGASDTGLPWYFAGYQIRTDRWPGP